MLLKAKILIAALSAASLTAAAIATGILVSAAPANERIATAPVQAPEAVAYEPVVTQQNRLNANPGAQTTEKNLTPPVVVPTTDESALTYGTKELPIPVVPDPAPGYAPWNNNIVYLLEGTNQPVTKAMLPTLPAGAVVQAIVSTKPAEGHFGSAYSILNRFVVQKVQVAALDGSQLTATRFLVYQDIVSGKIGPDKDADSFPGEWSFANSNLTVNQKLVNSGYAPLNRDNLAKSFTDEKGLTQEISDSQDMALIVARYKDTGVTAQLTLTYSWTTYPDDNHKAANGDGKIVFTTNFIIKRAENLMAGVYDNRISSVTHFPADFPALMYENLLFDGRKAELTVNNQFGTIAYTASRNAAGIPTGEIQPYGFRSDRKRQLADGKEYEVVTGGARESRDLIAGKLLGNVSAALSESFSKPIDDLYIGSSFIADSLALKNVTYDGTEFNIFSQIPADSAVSRTPLVSLRYKAATVDDAVKLLYRTNIDFNFMSSLYFTNPKKYAYGQLSGFSASDVQRFIDKPYSPFQLSDTKWLWAAKDLPANGSFDVSSNLLDFVNAGINNNLNDGIGDRTQNPPWTNENPSSFDPSLQMSDFLVRPRSAVQVPAIDHNMTGPMPDVWVYNSRSALKFEKQKSFNFKKFDPYKITQNQFFDVADFNFVASWSNYSADARNYMLSHLFNPDTTRLRVGAYIRYTGTELLFYLIPYITSLPKVSFAQIGGVTLNRDLNFSYQFFNVNVNIDQYNDTSAGWYNKK